MTDLILLWLEKTLQAQFDNRAMTYDKILYNKRKRYK